MCQRYGLDRVKDQLVKIQLAKCQLTREETRLRGNDRRNLIGAIVFPKKPLIVAIRKLIDVRRGKLVITKPRVNAIKTELRVNGALVFKCIQKLDDTAPQNNEPEPTKPECGLAFENAPPPPKKLNLINVY